MNVAQPLRALLTRRPAVIQAGLLFAIDGVINGIDYLFFIYLARVLLPPEFAAAQTINTVLLLLITGFAALQPVVARYVAETAVDWGCRFATASRTGIGDWGSGVSETAVAPQTAAIFRHYVGLSAAVGLVLFGAVWLTQGWWARWLNLPQTAVAIAAPMLLIAAVRPVVAGMLQGQQRFGWFGATRLAYALGRLATAVLMVSLLRLGLTGAIAAIPLGGLLALGLGLGCLGATVWQGGTAVPPQYRWRASPLSLNALVGYTVYIGLLSLDLVWVNRTLPDAAGVYATAVLLRRALILLPGAIVVIMYPRAVARVAKGELPDKLLAQTAAVIAVPTLALTAVLALWGRPLIRWTFGAPYEAAALLLGWMGLAMLGIALTSVWLNFFLATRPLPFVLILLMAAALQLLLLRQFGDSLGGVTAVFGVTAWVPALGGSLLYLLWLRPRMR